MLKNDPISSGFLHELIFTYFQFTFYVFPRARYKHTATVLIFAGNYVNFDIYHKCHFCIETNL